MIGSKNGVLSIYGKKEPTIFKLFLFPDLSLPQELTLSRRDSYLIQLVLLAKQEHIFHSSHQHQYWKNLLSSLGELDDFFFDQGGILGYERIKNELTKQETNHKKNVELLPPPLLDIRENFVKRNYYKTQCLNQLGYNGRALCNWRCC